MPTRRTFLKQSTAAGLAATTSIVTACSSAPSSTSKRTDVRKSGPRIQSVIRREETVRRYPYSGDNWHMSWSADDRLYVSRCDGFSPWAVSKGMYNSRLLTISGEPQNAQFADVPTYPELLTYAVKDAPRYYNFGTLAVDQRIYQFLSTWNIPASNLASIKHNELRYIGAKLIYSPDNGRTWCNQDGSTPVVWEDWNHRSRETLVFFEEDQEAFSLTSILQMGKGYEYNRDGYIYVYAPNGNTEGTMNELVMFRVAKGKLLDRRAYEYFAGLRADGSAQWAPDITSREVVHTFPRGWVNTLLHPFAWQPSVMYNAPLGLYLMANWATGPAPGGEWFGKPSYLGFWVSQNPWGPWEQIHEETAWLPGNDPKARAFAPQICPKWIAEDGKSFWLAWSDYQGSPEAAEEARRRAEEFKHLDAGEVARAQVDIFHRLLPNYIFNLQRVDLGIAE